MSTSTSEPVSLRPLGILGGTFDPLHRAHLALGLAAQQAAGLAGVRLIPTGRPGHRNAPHATPEHRLGMVRAALAADPALAGWTVDAGEVEQTAPSYTVPTFERLRREFGTQQPLALIMGADAFAGLDRWHRWQALPELCHLIVATRPGYPLETGKLPAALEALLSERYCTDAAPLAAAPAGRIFFCKWPPLDISATALRSRLLAGEPASALTDWLPPAVAAYIAAHGLYAPRSH